MYKLYIRYVSTIKTRIISERNAKMGSALDTAARQVNNQYINRCIADLLFSKLAMQPHRFVVIHSMFILTNQGSISLFLYK
jgi:hypothetical protein